MCGARLRAGFSAVEQRLVAALCGAARGRLACCCIVASAVVERHHVVAAGSQLDALVWRAGRRDGVLSAYPLILRSAEVGCAAVVVVIVAASREARAINSMAMAMKNRFNFFMIMLF